MACENSFTVRLFILILFLSAFVKLPGQVTNISGIVNSYHRVIEVIPAKACVRVDNITGLAYGNLVVLVQMKGATINTTASSSSFGDVTALNNAGNYELATICSVISDTVFFFHNLLNSYTTTDKVQLVRFGEYYSANVTATAKAASWDSATGKGGVLAIRTEEDLTLNASLFADSTGYKGGSFLMHSNNCSNFLGANNYAYDGSVINANTTGAYKGEGVAVVGSSQNGGRGAPANGGGGGNNHNNGGGGGANLTTGGSGGGNYTTVSGACNLARQGQGGKALSSVSGSKIFFGGGGGAGHVNNNTPTHGGGNGGGIVIIIAKQIIGNGFKISANGQTGADGGSDGASGGGSGGTIIMHVQNSYTGPLTIEANGGNGGTENNQGILNRCYGAGGGGSGGVIYFNGASPAVTISTNGGAAGSDIGVNGCGVPVPAVAGSSGSVINNYAYKTSVDPSSYCELLLPVKLISFEAQPAAEKKVLLKWEVANPQDAKSFSVERMNNINNWKTIGTVPAADRKNFYPFTDEMPKPGANIYRLKITERNNRVFYSAWKKVTINTGLDFSVFPNPAKDAVFIIGKFAAPAEIRLLDISGKIITVKKINPLDRVHEFLLPRLTPGTYLLQTENRVEKLFIY